LLTSQGVNLDVIKVVKKLANHLILQLLCGTENLLLLTNFVGLVLPVAQVEVGIGVERHTGILHSQVSVPRLHILVELEPVLGLQLPLEDLIHRVLERLCG